MRLEIIELGHETQGEVFDEYFVFYLLEVFIESVFVFFDLLIEMAFDVGNGLAEILVRKGLLVGHFWGRFLSLRRVEN